MIEQRTDDLVLSAGLQRVQEFIRNVKMTLNRLNFLHPSP